MVGTRELIEKFLIQSDKLESDIDFGDDNIDLDIVSYEINGNRLLITYSYKPYGFRRTETLNEDLLDYFTFIYNNK